MIPLDASVFVAGGEAYRPRYGFRLRLGRWILGATLLLAAACGFAPPASAQVILTPEGPKSLAPAEEPSGAGGRRRGFEHFQLTVTPAAEPQPALRYRLWMPEHLRKPGDASPFYYRAFLMYQQQANRQAVDEWLDKPLDQWPDTLPEILGRFTEIRSALVEATSREHCDWGWQLTQVKGTELYAFLLPEMQAMRDIARLLTLKIRWAIRQGDFEQAAEDLRIGYRMAYDCAQQPLLINGLVGIAIASIMNEQVLQWIDTPGSPSLYWALASLPRPLVELRPAVVFETEAVFRAFPVLNDPEHQLRSEAGWLSAWSESVVAYDALIEGSSGGQGRLRFLAGAPLVLAHYSAALEALQEQGMDRAVLEAMPAGQVVAIQQARTLRRLADELQSRAMLPYRERTRWEGEARAGQAAGERSSDKTSGESAGLLPLIQNLIPAVSAADDAQVRLEGQLAVLRAVEALRWHAAATGQLPQSLDQVRVAPVPPNPATGQPFASEPTGDGLTVRFQLPDQSGWLITLQLQPDR